MSLNEFKIQCKPCCNSIDITNVKIRLKLMEQNYFEDNYLEKLKTMQRDLTKIRRKSINKGSIQLCQKHGNCSCHLRQKKSILSQHSDLRFQQINETNKANLQIQKAFNYLQGIAFSVKNRFKQRKFSVIKEEDVKGDSHSETSSLIKSSDSNQELDFDEVQINEPEYRDKEKQNQKSQQFVDNKIQQESQQESYEHQILKNQQSFASVKNLSFLKRRKNIKVTSIQELFMKYSKDSNESYSEIHSSYSGGLKRLATNLNEISKQLVSDGRISSNTSSKEKKEEQLCKTFSNKKESNKQLGQNFSDELSFYHKQRKNYKSFYKNQTNTANLSSLSLMGDSINKSFTKNNSSIDQQSLKGICKNIRKLTEDLFERLDEQLSIKSKERGKYHQQTHHQFYSSADRIQKINRKHKKTDKIEEDFFKIVLKEVKPNQTTNIIINPIKIKNNQKEQQISRNAKEQFSYDNKESSRTYDQIFREKKRNFGEKNLQESENNQLSQYMSKDYELVLNQELCCESKKSNYQSSSQLDNMSLKDSNNEFKQRISVDKNDSQNDFHFGEFNDQIEASIQDALTYKASTFSRINKQNNFRKKTYEPVLQKIQE